MFFETHVDTISITKGDVQPDMVKALEVYVV